MNVLVLGSSGQVGRELLQAPWDADTQVIGLARPQFDLTRPETMDAALSRYAPDIVVNAAAYTAVDRAERDRTTAFAANSDGPAHLAFTAARRGIPLIHLSTDYVFSGTAARPYRETDLVAPINAYGLSKAAGEAAVRQYQPQHIILRTAWVYAAHGRNFVRTVLRLADERSEVAVVADQHGTPTASHDIAAALVTVIRRLRDTADIEAARGLWGTYHFTARGETTWAALAEHVLGHYERVRGRRPALRPIGTGEYLVAARRPARSSLDCERICSVFGIEAPPWQTSLDVVLNQLLPGA
jgi:dTDP-4-dehydrorhamnose reductase